MSNFEQLLTGGHPNSLGNTQEVVDQVLADRQKLEELYQCYFSHDEVVRLRTSSAMKRICKEHPKWLVPYLDKLLAVISQIDQASTQWTLAILFNGLAPEMSESQWHTAKEHLKHNLAHHQDWIVLNTTMDTLGQWAKEDRQLRNWMFPHLQRLKQDDRKSVARKAEKTMTLIQKHS